DWAPRFVASTPAKKQGLAFVADPPIPVALPQVDGEKVLKGHVVIVLAFDRTGTDVPETEGVQTMTLAAIAPAEGRKLGPIFAVIAAINGPPVPRLLTDLLRRRHFPFPLLEG